MKTDYCPKCKEWWDNKVFIKCPLCVIENANKALEDRAPSGQAESFGSVAERDDSDRIDQLREILMTSSGGFSDEIGLPRGWTDLRDALDAIA